MAAAQWGLRPEAAANGAADAHYDAQEAERYTSTNVQIQRDMVLRALQLLGLQVRPSKFPMCLCMSSPTTATASLPGKPLLLQPAQLSAASVRRRCRRAAACWRTWGVGRGSAGGS